MGKRNEIFEKDSVILFLVKMEEQISTFVKDISNVNVINFYFLNAFKQI